MNITGESLRSFCCRSNKNKNGKNSKSTPRRQMYSFVPQKVKLNLKIRCTRTPKGVFFAEKRTCMFITGATLTNSNCKLVGKFEKTRFAIVIAAAPGAPRVRPECATGAQRGALIAIPTCVRLLVPGSQSGNNSLLYLQR